MVVALLLASSSCALVDWLAVWRDREVIEALAKTLVPALLVGAIAVESPGTSAGLLVASALGFALVGDVLLLPAINRFVGGLAAFLVAHVLFIAAFVVAEPESANGAGALTASRGPGVIEVTLVVAGAFGAAALGWRIVTAVWLDQAQPRALVAAVSVYVVALTALVVAGLSTGEWLAATGALAFAVSDGVLGWNRFVAPLDHGRLVTHMLYHPALILITLWVLS